MAKNEKSRVRTWSEQQLNKINEQNLGKFCGDGESISIEIAKNIPSKENIANKGQTDGQVLIEYNGKKLFAVIEYKYGMDNLKKYEDEKLLILGDDGNIDKQAKGYALNEACFYNYYLIDRLFENSKVYDYVLSIGVSGGTENGEVKCYVDYYYQDENTKGNPICLFENQESLDLITNKKNIGELFTKLEKIKKFGNIDDVEIKEYEEEREMLIRALNKLNDDMYKRWGIPTNDRIEIIVACLLAMQGFPFVPENEFPPIENVVKPLELSSLDSSRNKKENDGTFIFLKVSNVLDAMKCSEETRKLILNEFDRVLCNNDNINHPDESGMSPLKQIYRTIEENILNVYRKNIYSTDFLGLLYNCIFSYDVDENDQENNVVFTPPHVTKFMTKICNVSQNSRVMDITVGSGGFLIAAMNEMIDSVKENDVTKKKSIIKSIKNSQVFGIEKKQNVYIWSLINMMLMGVNPDNILNGDSENLKDKKSKEFGRVEKFNANILLMNPPYVADYAGMHFLEYGLNCMKDGKASILITRSAGESRAKEINKRILKNNTLLSSIQMPKGLFGKKSSAHACIYLLDVGIPHDKNKMVKFINFEFDGYEVSDRAYNKNTYIDDGTAEDRYNELKNIIMDQKHDYIYFKEGVNYIRDTIDVESGVDWNFDSHVDNKLELSDDDFIQVVSEYLSFQVKQFKRNLDE